MGKIYTGKVGLEDIAFGVGTLTQVLGNGKTRSITKLNLQNIPFDELKTVGQALQEFNDLLVSQSYSTVNADLPKVKVTAENIDSINTLAESIADILTTANDILSINTVAADIDAVKAAPEASVKASQAVLNAQYIRGRLSQTQSTIYDYLQWLRAYHIEIVSPFQDKIDQALITLQDMIDNAVNTIMAGNAMAVKLATYSLEIQVHARCWTPSIIIDDPNHRIVWHIPESKNQCVVVPGAGGGDCNCDEVTQGDVENAFPDAPPLVVAPTINCIATDVHILENNVIGATIRTLTGDDGGEAAVWSVLVGQTAVSIDQNGVITANIAYDYETTDSYSIAVRYLNSQGHNADCLFTLYVDDEAEGLLPPTLEAQAFTIVEGNTIGDVVGQLVVADDGGDSNIFFTLDLNDHFDSDANGQLTAKEVYDFDIDPQHIANVIATNGEGDSNSVPITVNVTDAECIETSACMILIDQVEAQDGVTLNAGTVVGTPEVVTSTTEWREGCPINFELVDSSLLTFNGTDFVNTNALAVGEYTTDYITRSLQCTEATLTRRLRVLAELDPPLVDSKTVTYAYNSTSSTIRQYVYDADHSGYSGGALSAELLSPLDNPHIFDAAIYNGNQVEIKWDRSTDDFCGEIPVRILVSSDTGSCIYELSINVEKLVNVNGTPYMLWYADAGTGDLSINKLEDFFVANAECTDIVYTIATNDYYEVADATTGRLSLKMPANQVDGGVSIIVTYTSSCGIRTSNMYGRIMQVPTIGNAPGIINGGTVCPSWSTYVVANHDTYDSIVSIEGSGAFVVNSNGTICSSTDLDPEGNNPPNYNTTLTLRSLTNYGKYSEWTDVVYEVNP